MIMVIILITDIQKSKPEKQVVNRPKSVSSFDSCDSRLIMAVPSSISSDRFDVSFISIRSWIHKSGGFGLFAGMQPLQQKNNFHKIQTFHSSKQCVVPQQKFEIHSCFFTLLEVVFHTCIQHFISLRSVTYLHPVFSCTY